MKEDLTQKELKSRLNYDPLTGIFTWKTSYRSRLNGNIAGCKNPNGYIYIKLNEYHYLAHRLAWLYMTGQWPQDKIDHRDHIRDRNVWNNLREATNFTNNQNATKRHDNTSDVTGVIWQESRQKWNVKIGVNGVRKYLGSFTNKQKAIAVRKAAEVMYGYHGNHGDNRV